MPQGVLASKGVLGPCFDGLPQSARILWLFWGGGMMTDGLCSEAFL
jgi:hypothetical protein